MDLDYVGPSCPAWPDITAACVWLPRLPLRAEVLRHPNWDGRPLVLGGGPGERKVVQLCSPEAERSGIRPGLPLREVLPLCRRAIVVEPDPVRLAAVLEDTLRQLQRVTPAVEMAEPGRDSAANPPRDCFFLDLHGLEMAYGGSIEAFEHAIREALPARLQARVGFAAGKFNAWLAAQMAPESGWRLVEASDSRGFLDPLPVGLLPFSPEALERLSLLGIRRIGQLAALPFSAVQAQFGRTGAQAWRLAHGRDDERIVARPYSPSVLAVLRCDDPPSSVEAFWAALDQLLGQAFDRPAMQGASARQLRLRALLSGGASWERSFTFKEALAGYAAVREALRGKLQAASMLPPAPVEELSVELLGLGPEVGRQLPLFRGRTRQQERLDEAARQLAARYGETALYQPIPLEPWSRLPERQWALAPVVAARRERRKRLAPAPATVPGA